MAGKPIVPHTSACAACERQSNPQNINQVTVSIALADLRDNPERRDQVFAVHGAWLDRPVGAPVDNSAKLAEILAGSGPGSQLWRLLETLGVKHTTDCECLGRAERMNAWGVAGCRAARGEIVAWMVEGKDRYGWAGAVKAATAGVAEMVSDVLHGRWPWLNPLDPFGSLVDEAIRRAEVAEASDVQQVPAA